MRKIFDVRSLTTQLIIAFIAVVLLTAVTVGLPAIWLLQNQLDRQAWLQVEQGQSAVIALYNAQHREVLNLSTLTAQRPTLQELLIEDDILALTEYLHTLKQSAGLTQIIICDTENRMIATTDEHIPESICQQWRNGKYQYSIESNQVCLSAHQPIGGPSGTLGEVFVCRQLDNAFASQIGEETGLEHTIWIRNQPIATSLEAGTTHLKSHQLSTISQAELVSQHVFEIDEVPYYAAGLILDEMGLSAEVSLDVTALHTTRNQLARTLVASILGIVFIGSFVGVMLSQRISRPLVRLADAAEAFSRGDLETPVDTQTSVREVAQVAFVLESARTDLLETLVTLQAERDWSNHLLASIVEGIMILDKAGRITFFSHGAERITGWSHSEMLGQFCDDVFRLESGQQAFTKAIPETRGRVKADVILAGGRVASLAITRAELTPTQATEAEIALVFRDISEEETVHRIMGHFLANVAHEFRTPLAALAASIELLLDQAPDLKPAELHELLISLHLGTLGLQTLVDNLLESASIEAGRFHISPRATELGTIVAEATGTLQPLLAKYEQHLTVELPINLPIVHADPRRIVQVLVNLLANASKYGPSEATIQLKVTTHQHEVRVSVTDRGPGIPPGARSDIFRRFVYPHQGMQTSQAGAGLGLSVVKAIVEAHGGQVGVDDHPGGGSTFWFTLPVAKDEE